MVTARDIQKIRPSDVHGKDIETMRRDYSLCQTAGDDEDKVVVEAQQHLRQQTSRDLARAS